MDFDIDAVLDQLEKTLNQSDHEEKENQSIQSQKKSTDDLLLLDLDPFGCTNNQQEFNHEQNNEDKLKCIKQDLEDIYAISNTINSETVTTSILPDVINDQQDDLSSILLPLAVEQLEIEVRQEILQHTLEQTSPSLLVPDLTTISNDNNNNDDDKEIDLKTNSINDEENLSSKSIIETSDNIILTKESDLIQDETNPILHSVDSIVNLPTVTDHEIFIVSNQTLMNNESMKSSTELVFSTVDDDQEEVNELISEEIINDDKIPSISMNITSPVVTQDFDLVKNVLSEIFDKPDEEILDENLIENKESELVTIEQSEILSSTIPITNNDEEDFRFLDEMLASMDVSDSDIHQLTPAEIDRVDNLLKEIVNTHQVEDVTSASATNEIESSLPIEEPAAAAAALIESSSESITTSGNVMIPIDEELIRVEQEWSKLTEEEKRLGSIAPEWVSDDLAPVCMKCSLKFSITRRRHHCRACGKVFCSTCCWQKVKLIHEDSKEDRACNDCVRIINNVEYLWNYMRNNQKPRSSVLRKKPGN